MNMQITPPADNRDVPAHETQPGAHPARRYAIGGIAIILVLGGFYYWTHSGDNAPRRGPIVAPVRVANVVQRDMEVVEHTIGTVVANSTVSVTACSSIPLGSGSCTRIPRLAKSSMRR